MDIWNSTIKLFKDITKINVRSIGHTNYAFGALSSAVEVAIYDPQNIGISVGNDTDATGYLLLGDGDASSSNFTTIVPAQSLYESPWFGGVRASFIVPSATAGNVGVTLHIGKQKGL